MTTGTIPITGDAEADRLLTENPLALLIGMLLDQQVPMGWAFRGPFTLKERLGGSLDAETIAAMGPDKIEAVFRDKPAMHRYPGSMGRRTHALSAYVVEHYGGDAGAIWRGARRRTKRRCRHAISGCIGAGSCSAFPASVRSWPFFG